MSIQLPAHKKNDIAVVDINGHSIKYVEQAAGWRYMTLAEKEPETIEWIDTFEAGDIFWDIGANIGIYSIYAGMRDIQTVAFEPHFANYQQLCLTTGLNGLQDKITPLCLAFSEAKSIGAIHLASTEVGTSMSSFGQALDFRGRPYQASFRQGMIAYDIDSFIEDFKVAIPSHIKIDVDGLELPIIQGARKTLANPKLVSVSVELIESDATQVAEVTSILKAAGLHFIHKKQNSKFATKETHDVLNYLFHRNPTKLQLQLSEKNIDSDLCGYSVNDIVNGIIKKISQASIDGSPTENIFMEEIFPKKVYQQLLKNLPKNDILDPIIHPDALRSDGQCTRYLLDLTEVSISRLDTSIRSFWTAMHKIFTAPELSKAVVEKFNVTLRSRFGDILPELIAVPIIYRDYPGYRIGIHPDTASKIATLQFYLPEDDSQRHLGTSFHVRNGSSFEKVKTNLFLPNSAYAFARTEESWHSVDELESDERIRNTIALTFYIKGQEYSSDNNSSMSSQEDKEDQKKAMQTPLHDLVKKFKRRENVVQLFKKDAVGIELGVAAGDFSERILKHDHVAYLFSIDMWAGDRGHGVDQYREAIVRLDPYRQRNMIMRMRFDEALPLFSDDSLDFIYVDGYAHDGELNGSTFRDWFPKLRKGGIIAGDDYSPKWPLVVAAVDAFAAVNGLDVHIIDCQEDNWNSMYPTWFAFKP
jgi:FkbM family methyltransferase